MGEEKMQRLETQMAFLQMQLADVRSEVDTQGALRTFGAFTEQVTPPAYYPSRGAIVSVDPASGSNNAAPGSIIPDDATDRYLKCYSFETVSVTGLASVVMEPGDVFYGPLVWVLWADITYDPGTGSKTAPAVSSSNTHVWLECSELIPDGSHGSLGGGYVTMKVGSKADMMDALDETERLGFTVCPILETTWASSKITKVKNLQCGDVKIYRAA